jgi:hypothetical protein
MRSNLIKGIFLFIMLLTFGKSGIAQNFDNILNYHINGTPTHGVKIKTNLPFVPDGGMPTITIKGYSYGPSEPINLTLTFYVWWVPNDPATYYFHNPRISSSGAYTPPVYLSNEGGKVVIFIDDRIYFQRFTVSAFGQGDNETLSWFQGWTAVDEPMTGTKTVAISYRNRFHGEVFMPGNSLWNSEKGHLPGIPPADEVKANGIDLGEMNAKLLQKIEELTLYMIDTDKKINALQKENQSLKNQINKIVK